MYIIVTKLGQRREGFIDDYKAWKYSLRVDHGQVFKVRVDAGGPGNRVVGGTAA